MRGVRPSTDRTGRTLSSRPACTAFAVRAPAPARAADRARARAVEAMAPIVGAFAPGRTSGTGLWCRDNRHDAGRLPDGSATAGDRSVPPTGFEPVLGRV